MESHLNKTKYFFLPIPLIICCSYYLSRNLKFSKAHVHLMDYSSNGNIQRERILDMHNMLRSYEAGGAWGKGAVYMLRLVYDMGLERYAKNYAEKLCQTGHWGHSKREPPLRVAPGENLYVNTIDYSGKSPLEFDPAVVVKKWWDERKYYDWNARDPSAKAKSLGQLIGHYTQIVRAEASAVGCWIITGCQCKNQNHCRKENNPPYWSTYMACHYDFGNVGWFPYWPLAFPSKIPRSISQDHRKRCGNCPKGYSECGTTGGRMNRKRDAYLCVGFWDKNKRLPSPNLLLESIKRRHSSRGLPSWMYMVRNCNSNGGCPQDQVATGSKCWKYKQGQLLSKEPRVLYQQCICNSFRTSKGTWFQRDSCLSAGNAIRSQPLTRYGVLSLSDGRHGGGQKLLRKYMRRAKDHNSKLYNFPNKAEVATGKGSLNSYQDNDMEENLKAGDNSDTLKPSKVSLLDFENIKFHEEGTDQILLEIRDLEKNQLNLDSLDSSNGIKIPTHVSNSRPLFKKEKNKNFGILYPDTKESLNSVLSFQPTNESLNISVLHKNISSPSNRSSNTIIFSDDEDEDQSFNPEHIPHELEIEQDLINNHSTINLH